MLNSEENTSINRIRIIEIFGLQGLCDEKRGARLRLRPKEEKLMYGEGIGKRSKIKGAEHARAIGKSLRRFVEKVN